MPIGKANLNYISLILHSNNMDILILLQYTLANPNSSVPMFKKIVRISEFVPISEITLIQ